MDSEQLNDIKYCINYVKARINSESPWALYSKEENLLVAACVLQFCLVNSLIKYGVGKNELNPYYTFFNSNSKFAKCKTYLDLTHYLRKVIISKSQNTSFSREIIEIVKKEEMYNLLLPKFELVENSRYLTESIAVDNLNWIYQQIKKRKQHLDHFNIAEIVSQDTTTPVYPQAEFESNVKNKKRGIPTWLFIVLCFIAFNVAYSLFQSIMKPLSPYLAGAVMIYAVYSILNSREE